jgi:ubiquinone/menaquinone biosynthesis C-methylase UbiE
MIISFDRIADIYDRTRGFPDYVMVKITDVLKKELKNQKLILDVGVGTGRFAGPLQKIGFRIVGIDIAEKMLAKASERRIENLTMGDARYLPFRDSTFDITITVHILHLISDWKSALKEIVRVTKHDLITIMHWREDYNETPNGMYKEIVTKLGYSYEHPGIGEWKLEEMVEPSQKQFLTTYKNSVEKSIEFLNDKAYSYQWNIPDELHESAMKELRNAFNNKSEYANDLYLVKWNASEIAKTLVRSKAKDLPR